MQFIQKFSFLYHILYVFYIVVWTLDVKAPFISDNTVRGGRSHAEKKGKSNLGVGRKWHVANAKCHVTSVWKVLCVSVCSFSSGVPHATCHLDVKAVLSDYALISTSPLRLLITLKPRSDLRRILPTNLLFFPMCISHKPEKADFPKNKWKILTINRLLTLPTNLLTKSPINLLR